MRGAALGRVEAGTPRRFERPRIVDVARALRQLREARADYRSAGERSRRGIDACAVIRDIERRSVARLVSGKVGESEAAAFVAHVLRDRGADVATIDCLCTVARDRIQRIGEAAL